MSYLKNTRYVYPSSFDTRIYHGRGVLCLAVNLDKSEF